MIVIASLVADAPASQGQLESFERLDRKSGYTDINLLRIGFQSCQECPVILA